MPPPRGYCLKASMTAAGPVIADLIRNPEGRWPSRYSRDHNRHSRVGGPFIGTRTIRRLRISAEAENLVEIHWRLVNPQGGVVDAVLFHPLIPCQALGQAL